MDSFGTSFILSDYGGTYDDFIGGTITGCPAGVEIDFDFIQSELTRRAPSSHPNSTQRCESDRVQFLSGVENGKTTGAPIEFRIPNEDVLPDPTMLHIMKPSHASFTYKMKYGITDNSGIGRASARQTACRVVGGAIAKLYLQKFAIEIHCWEDDEVQKYRENTMKEPENEGNTFGTLVHCAIKNLPAGLGEPVYDKFDARLAYSILSINACKGFETGKGFAAAKMKGSEYNDIQNADFTFQSNNDGGVQAGITNGQEVYFSAVFKPVPTLQKAQKAVDFEGKPTFYTGSNRNDRCVVPRVLPVIEAMAAMVVADFVLQNRYNISYLKSANGFQKLLTKRCK